jgi:hypothetical protein
MSISTNIGKLGEYTLATWASQVDMGCNPSTDDRKGWDFILEFDNQKPEKFLDKKPASYSSFIQVKTTSTSKTSIPVKLSNWERMVKNPLPSFSYFYRSVIQTK